MKHWLRLCFTLKSSSTSSATWKCPRSILPLMPSPHLRHNFTVMTRYISNPYNLKLMMNMLKEKSRNIQFEAFHVFKVFVANPNKPKPILDILLRNQDLLVEFLTRFHTDRSEDEQFNDEKAYLIKQIKELKPIAGDNQ
uniref:Protein Mo25 n=1 Tax=Cacopsylla melanoneura TaxID=428564 RepID=A0A8D8VIG2_9HEMI